MLENVLKIFIHLKIFEKCTENLLENLKFVEKLKKNNKIKCTKK